VIALAYEQEMYATGRSYVIRWGAPDAKFPLGALEIVPMRRNPSLLRFRDQLTNAILTRSTSPQFASVITGRATLKMANGKHRKITYKYTNQQAVRRFGFVHKLVDYNSVNSELELQVLVKREMAFRLTPLRTAELNHPGIATIRRGDAIKIDIPEEGYGDIALGALGKPAVPKSKQSALALRKAELSDPMLFGLQSQAALSALSSANVSGSYQPNTDQQMLVPIADQSIAFVTSAQHTASAGSYTMDLQTSFIDTLDPATVKAEMEANIREGKTLRQVGA
jgi:hypothetical protein